MFIHIYIFIKGKIFWNPMLCIIAFDILKNIYVLKNLKVKKYMTGLWAAKCSETRWYGLNRPVDRVIEWVAWSAVDGRRVWQRLVMYLSHIDKYVPNKVDFETIFSEWVAVKVENALRARWWWRRRVAVHEPRGQLT